MEKKKQTQKKNTTEKRAKRNIDELDKNTAKKKQSQNKADQVSYTPPSNLKVQLVQAALVLIALFIAFCLIFPAAAGTVGKKISEISKGIFSVGACFIPCFIVLRAVFYRKDSLYANISKNWILSLVCVVIVSILSAAFDVDKVEGFKFVEFYTSGQKWDFGGIVGGMFYNLLDPSIGKFFTVFLSFASFVIILPFLCGSTPIGVLRSLFEFIADKRTERKAINEKRSEYIKQEEEKAQKEAEKEKIKELKKERKKEFDVDITVDEESDTLSDNEKEIQENIPIEEIESDITDTKIIDLTPAEALNEVFGESESEDEQEERPSEEFFEEDAAQTDIKFDNTEAAEELFEKEDITTDEVPQAENVYRFPPTSLLNSAKAVQNDDESEYENTAKKLVDTLASFGIKTKLINISKGPTVTRYELRPDVGVRVRAIKNSAEDIAMNLAAKGVRIEAPIPGKEAVGIEVPNKQVSTVYIRELIESQAFVEAKSKLTTCLGKDVAGNTILCDIAKMPHMLIAGATGMGKSVCINSIIISILYKAMPSEVKFILIDPKKVEFNLYNGIPHLLVPVVSDPKKAAGSLCWAVTEMERRFALIEEVGVREITAYNRIAEKDEGREKLPQIVIIIDELADLMMMARDDVENSICRLAQKARAAGMHLVIGTQRPSVDVITGLIKANVPSRIACTVASQIDSRTIIDINGAEKLLGRGDMLYAPVGSTNPIRVQGSFVSDSEIESIIDYICNSMDADYSDEIMESIEREAQRCGEKKHTKESADGAADDGINLDSDPMLKQAIEIAYESGSVSSSNLQRRLKLGYNRAARIVDMMEALKIIGPYAGAKPREILMSRQAYLEMLSSYESK